MSSKLDFNVFVGAETGILKGVSINPKLNLSKNFHKFEKLSKEEEIRDLIWKNENEILLGTRSNVVKTYDIQEKCFTNCLNLNEDTDLSPLVGLSTIKAESSVIISAHQNGNVKVWRFKNPLTFNAVQNEVLHKAQSGRRKNHNKLNNLNDSENEEEKSKLLLRMSLGRELCKIKTHANNLCLTGKEIDLQLWDLEKDTQVWSAKNVPPDNLQLRVPVWNADLEFLGPHILSSVSKYGHIRLYDVRAQRRPVTDLLFPDEEPLNCQAKTKNDRQIIVGGTRGTVALYDFRQETRGMFRKYKGSVGSVRDIDTFDGQSDYFASVGLDRFIRIYNINSKKIVSKMYLKSRLNRVLLTANFDPLVNERDRVDENKDQEMASDDDDIKIIEEDEEKDEAMWNKMDQINEPSKKTAKKRTLADLMKDLEEKPVIVSSNDGGKKKKIKKLKKKKPKL